MKIIEFIRANPNWREILSSPPYSIRITDDGGFTMLKYSQIDSDLGIDIVRECRGLIIDGDYNPVCIPFFKFGNYGEPYADKINWATARVEEKIDGSLIKLWHNNGKWIISTNGTIFAENASISSQHGDKCDEQFSNFYELFKAAANNAGLNVESLNPQYTYMFEVCSPYNRVVVPHEEIKLFHIGARDNATLEELDLSIGIPKPKTYQCDNIGDLIEMAAKLRYCEEGYVVRDGDYRRIKVKSPSYVAVHHLISDMSDKKLLELIRKNETAEFLTYFPEYKSFIDNLKGRIAAFEEYINNAVTELAKTHFETRKDFAALALKTKYPAFFFNWFDQKAKTPAQWLWNQTNDKVLENLDKLG